MGQALLKMHEFSVEDLFVPNSKISKEVMWGVQLVTLSLVYVLWTFWPGLELIPRPHEIASALVKLFATGSLLEEVVTSIILFLTGTFFVLLIGLPLAYLSRLPGFQPLIEGICTLRYASLYGFTFLFGTIVKDTYSLKIWLLVFGMLPYFLTSMVDAVKVPEDEIDNGKTLRQSDWEILYHTVIIGRRHKVIEILRQNAAMGWMMLAMVEAISMGQGGVGTMLVKETKASRLDAVYAVQVTIFCIGIMCDYGFKALLLTMCPYKRAINGGLNYE